jgi:hypothetical protein
MDENDVLSLLLELHALHDLLAAQDNKMEAEIVRKAGYGIIWMSHNLLLLKQNNEFSPHYTIH